MKLYYPHNKPLPPPELQILQYLQPRMRLSSNDQLHYDNLRKGYRGELKFYHLLASELTKNRIVLFDLLLKSNNTEFQIDSMIIEKNIIYCFEVKNFEGDFYIKEDKWYSITSGKEIRNPILQLKRSEFLLRQILQKRGYNFQIKPYIIFINDQFTLYQAPLNQPFILPTQLQRFIKKLDALPSNPTSRQKKIAKQLVSMHINKSAHSYLPEYDYNQLNKGITCTICYRFLSPLNKGWLKCKYCNSEVRIDSAIMSSIIEFNLLFPNKKITTSAIHEWCKIIKSKKTIRRILIKNLVPIKKGRGSHYVFST